MFRGEWDDGETSHSYQWGSGEEFIGFDFGEGDGFGKGLAGADFHLGIFGVGEFDRNHRGCADNGFLIAGFVDDEVVAGLHGSEVSESDWIVDSVPDGLFVFLQVGKGVLGWLGFEEVGVWHGSSLGQEGKKEKRQEKGDSRGILGFG